MLERPACDAGEERHVAGHEQAMGMVDWQGMEKRVIGSKAPDLFQGQRVGNEVVVRQHGSLGAARRPRCVEDRSQVLARPLHRLEGLRHLIGGFGQRALTFRVQRLDAASSLCGNRSDALALAGVADDQRWLGVADEVFQLGQRIGRIEGQVDGSSPRGREIQEYGRNGFLDLCCDTVARLDPAGDKHVRETTGQRDEVGIADGLARGGRDCRPGRVGDRALQPVKQVRIHGKGSKTRVDDGTHEGVERAGSHGVGTRSRDGRSARRVLRTAVEAATLPFSANASWFASISSSA